MNKWRMSENWNGGPQKKQNRKKPTSANLFEQEEPIHYLCRAIRIMCAKKQCVVSAGPQEEKLAMFLQAYHVYIFDLYCGPETLES